MLFNIEVESTVDEEETSESREVERAWCLIRREGGCSEEEGEEEPSVTRVDNGSGSIGGGTDNSGDEDASGCLDVVAEVA